MSSIQIVYQRREELPRLAWCAHVADGQARVSHGPWVEVRPEGFVEGVWDGGFEAFDFDRAPNHFGSGGRLRDGKLIFSAATHPLEWLYVVEAAGEMRVSNSLAFLLAEIEDGPDLAHPGYFFDVLRHFRQGVSEGDVALPTATGRRVRLFAVCNFECEAGRAVRVAEKDPGPEPSDYEHYRSLLGGAMERLFANGADPVRRNEYRPVAAVSRGYDSAAAAAVASQAGCRDALTFAQSNSARGWINDHGGLIADALGLSVQTVDRHDYYTLPIERQAEWFLTVVGSGEKALGASEDLLEGRILVTGRRGETTWGRGRQTRSSRLANHGNVILSGPDSIEQRLRCGYVQLHAAMIGARHGTALDRINSSPQTLAYVAEAAAYQRPAARRLAEDCGVPGDAFGMEKSGGAGRLGPLGPEAIEAFETFYEERVPERVRRTLRDHNSERRRKLHIYLRRLWARFAQHPVYDPLLERLGVHRMHLAWKMRDLYQFHWGLLQTMDRYRVAPKAKAASHS